MQELEARVALVVARKFTPLGMTNLLKRFGSAAAVCGAGKSEILKTPKVNRKGPDALAEVIRSGEHLREIEKAKENGIGFVMLEDEAYPEALRRIPDPPPLLYVRGELRPDDALALAIVGGRSSTYYGNSQAARFSRDFAGRGITVVSGLARGVDTAAHRAALEAGGRTIAVVGSGLLDVYPPDNELFALDVAENGAVISEFTLETPGVARNFPQRNRLISGLSLGVLVIEATLRSGSLITARMAADQGREVFALPGKVDAETSAGPHELIRQGAHLVAEPRHIYDELDAFKVLPEKKPEPGKKKSRSAVATRFNFSPYEEVIWKSLMPSDGMTTDEVVAASGVKLSIVASSLMMLEMKGAAKRLPGKRYVRLE
jgi:DNA processing protein